MSNSVTHSSWDRKRFVEGIQFAMQMGAANDATSVADFTDRDGGGNYDSTKDHNRVVFVIPVDGADFAEMYQDSDVGNLKLDGFTLIEPFDVGQPRTEADNITRVALYTDFTGTPYDLNTHYHDATYRYQTLENVAVEWEARQSASRYNGMGDIDRSRATFYVFGTTAVEGVGVPDILAIEGATHAMISGVKYKLEFSGPVAGLFDVDIHQIFAEAEDETIDWN